MLFYNSIIGCNNELFKKVWHADKGMCAMPGATSCWTAEFMAAFEGLQGRDQYRNAVRSGSAVNVKSLQLICVLVCAKFGRS